MRAAAQRDGPETFPAGAKPESATAIKLANNAVLGCAMVAMAEGFSLVRKYDVLPQVFQDVMTEGLFSAPAYKVYGQKMVDESYDQVGSPIFVGLKDAGLIAAAADLARVPMPSHNVYLRAPAGRRRTRRWRPRSGGARPRTGTRVRPRIAIGYTDLAFGSGLSALASEESFWLLQERCPLLNP